MLYMRKWSSTLCGLGRSALFTSDILSGVIFCLYYYY